MVAFLLKHRMLEQAREIGWDNCWLLIGTDAYLRQQLASPFLEAIVADTFLQAGGILEDRLPSVVVIDFALGRSASLEAAKFLRHSYPFAKRVAIAYEDEMTNSPPATDVFDNVLVRPVKVQEFMEAVMPTKR